MSYFIGFTRNSHHIFIKMNSVLISIIFIITCANREMYANSIADIDPTCLQELQRDSNNLLECINVTQFDRPDVKIEVQSVLFEQPADENAIRQFGVKYCKIGYELIKCLPNFLVNTTECSQITPGYGSEIESDVKSLWNFVCRNNSEEFVQLVINGGVGILMENINLAAECADHIKNATLTIAIGEDTSNAIRICDSINQANRCHLRWIEPTGNTHLKHFINALHELFAEALECNLIYIFG